MICLHCLRYCTLGLVLNVNYSSECVGFCVDDTLFAYVSNHCIFVFVQVF